VTVTTASRIQIDAQGDLRLPRIPAVLSPRPPKVDLSCGDTPERVTWWKGLVSWATLCPLQSSNMTSESILMGVGTTGATCETSVT